MQLIDARDIARFMLDSIERGTPGTFNVTGRTGNATMGSWLADAAAAVGSDVRLTWVDDDFLVGQDLEPWTDLPLWMPPGQDGDHAWHAETAAAQRAGLTTRPVSETVRDTWAWMAATGLRSDDPDGRFRNNGIAPAREEQLLEAWRAR
jgi:2'-hydroxyisoflavone reductase